MKYNKNIYSYYYGDRREGRGAWGGCGGVCSSDQGKQGWLYQHTNLCDAKYN
jgi:hypothetical protein